MKDNFPLWPAFFLLLLPGCAPKPESFYTTGDLKGFMIAYTALLDEEKGDYEVFVMNPDGTGQKNISNWEGVDWAYYTCQDKIYFLSDRDTCHHCYLLYETDTDGNIRKVTNFLMADSQMSARKAGQELIVRPKATLDSAFYIINLQGEILKKIYPGLAYLNDPCFSPDGKQVVFRGSKTPRSKDNENHIDELFIMDDDGKNLRQLTHYPATDTTARWYNYHAGPPHWAPRDNLLTFSSFQKKKETLFAIQPDGKGLRQLWPGGYHDWSPNQRHMAYGLEGADGNFDIWLIGANGNGNHRLTSDSLFEHGPLFVKVEK